MFAPETFRVDDREKLTEAIQRFPFATLARNGQDGPIFAYAPLILTNMDGGGRALIGHVARANPFWKNAAGEQATALFSGPDGYISPSNYPSKAEHGRVVPTWNYIRIEARGALFVETDAAKLRRYVDLLTERMESDRNTPWSVDDAPADFIAKLSRGIVGVQINVSSIEGAWKLGQQSTKSDRDGAINGLRADGANELAQEMSRAAKEIDKDKHWE